MVVPKKDITQMKSLSIKCFNVVFVPWASMILMIMFQTYPDANKKCNLQIFDGNLKAW